jgi:hypothetical protein
MRSHLYAAIALAVINTVACGGTPDEITTDETVAALGGCNRDSAPIAMCDGTATINSGCSEYRGDLSRKVMESLESGCRKSGGSFHAGAACPKSPELLGWCPSATEDGVDAMHFYYRDDSLFRDDAVPRKVCNVIGQHPWCSVD